MKIGCVFVFYLHTYLTLYTLGPNTESSRKTLKNLVAIQRPEQSQMTDNQERVYGEQVFKVRVGVQSNINDEGFS